MESADQRPAPEPSPSPGPPGDRPTGPPAAAHPAHEAHRTYREARRVLGENWTGAATVPSRGLYPHQWSWDSAFIAIGLRHLSPHRAQRELETLLRAQWADGRIPHIVFNPAVPHRAYFPSPDFWQAHRAAAAAGAPPGLETSGIVQPPVHALAAWLVHQADPAASARRGFLARVYPRLVAWQRYLTGRRDLGGSGLASIVHPWESGMDNSPCWDVPLSTVPPAPADSFRRADLDHGAPDDRPTDLDYCRYVRLAADYRDHGYDDAATPHRFAVEDPGFNALLAASEHALAEIAVELRAGRGGSASDGSPVDGSAGGGEVAGGGQGAGGGESAVAWADPAEHLVRAEELTTGLVKRLWDAEAGQFLARDVRTGAPLAERSAAGLVPLLLPGLPAHVSAALLRTVRGPHFGLGGPAPLVPSYALTGPAFDPCRYWRGPAWFNINWLLERGLRGYGARHQADRLRAAMLRAAPESGFSEYVDPHTGAARGTRDFSWTAALVLDLLAEEPEPQPEPEPAGARPGADAAPAVPHTAADAAADAVAAGRAPHATAEARADTDADTDAAAAAAAPDTIAGTGGTTGAAGTPGRVQ